VLRMRKTTSRRAALRGVAVLSLAAPLVVAALAFGAAPARACVLNVKPSGSNEPTWSPDGRHVAYVEQPYGVIVVLNLRTHAITGFGPGDAPRWSPDGSKLAFSRLVEYTAPAGGSICDSGPIPVPFLAWEEDIFTAPLDGTAARNLTNTIDVQEVPLAWLPSGRIAFQYNTPSGPVVATMNADGSDVQRVNLPGWVDAATWSPTGQQLAYVANNRIYVANADGGNPRAITRNWQNAYQPAWSPDGRKLAFARFGSINTSGIYVMNSDGRHMRHVLSGWQTEPSWSPDGRRLVYTQLVRRSGIERLYVKDLRNDKPGIPLY
jgi:Tol biopolymer transport system component